jgi:hypothetical protein
MSNQRLNSISEAAGVDSHLAELVDQWITELSGGEFKIAAYLYRSLEQAGGRGVHLSARELAEAAGVSTSAVETGRKVLVAKGIVRLAVNRQGAWYRYPKSPAQSAYAPAATTDQRTVEIAEPRSAPAEESSSKTTAGSVKTTEREGEVKLIAEAAPEAAWSSAGGPRRSLIFEEQDIKAADSAKTAEPDPNSVGQPSSSAETAEPDLQTDDPTGLTAEPPLGPASLMPSDMPRSDRASGSVEITEPERRTELVADAPAAAQSSAPAAAIISVLQRLQSRVLQTIQNHRADPAAMAGAESLAPGAEQSLPVAETAAPGARSAAADPPTIEGNLAAALQQLTGHEAAPAFIKRLQDSVDDAALLLECLQWMLARGELYEDGNLLYSRILYLCGQRDGLFQSPFRTERRAEQDDQRRPK